jgi:urease accessory protein
VTRQSEESTAGIARLMLALQFSDSMLPIGAFSFSNGLEAAVQQHVVHDPATLAEFTLTAVHRAATSDGIALLEAHRAASNADVDGVVAADQAVLSRKLSEEMRTMTIRMGRKLAELGTSVVRAPVLGRWLDEIVNRMTPGTYPAGLGALFADIGSPEQDAFAVHQYGVAMSTLSAALRLMRIEPRVVQAVLHEINASSEKDYAVVRALSLTEMAGFAPASDILAAMHIRAHVRMFMN